MTKKPKQYFGIAEKIRSWIRNINATLVYFVFSLCVISFGYGVIAQKYKLFPQPLIAEAGYALSAMRGMDKDNLMYGLLSLDNNAPAAPTTKHLYENAGTEYILVTGGPYFFMEECPNFGCVAWITDRAGNVVHSWDVDLEALFDGITGISGRTLVRNFHPVGIALDTDGSLYVTFDGRNMFPYQVGMAKIGPNGEIIWKKFQNSHHWPLLTDDGLIITPSVEVVPSKRFFAGTKIDTRCHREGYIYDEGVRIMDRRGNILREFSVMDIFKEAGRFGYFYGIRDGCDPVHINAVEIVTPEAAAGTDEFEAGDLLLSIREINSLAVIDELTGELKKVYTGYAAAQHSPKFLPDGTVLVVDNRGGDASLGGTRIVRLNLVTEEAETVFPARAYEGVTPFYSSGGGLISVSPDGKRFLVSLEMQPRVLEIDVETGEPLWLLQKASDISQYLELSGAKASATRGFFRSMGAYYVTDTAFLDSSAAAGAQ